MRIIERMNGCAIMKDLIHICIGKISETELLVRGEGQCQIRRRKKTHLD